MTSSFPRYFWQIIATLLALIAIFATYNVYYMGRPTKELQVIDAQPIPLVQVRPEATQDIQVFYKGEAVSNLFLLPISIKNVGNQPIVDTDYSRPLSFTFSSEYRLVDVAITSSDPTNIGMSISKTSEQKAIASKTLLNPGDKISARFIIIGGNRESLLSKLYFDGRILGIREIERLSSGDSETIQDATVWIWLAIAVTFLLAIFIFGVGFGTRLERRIASRDSSSITNSPRG